MDFSKIYNRKMLERAQFAELYYGDKILRYDPSIDYTKKTGPLNSTIDYVNGELSKAENGGKGLPGETIIKPLVEEGPFHKEESEDLAPEQAPPALPPMPEGAVPAPGGGELQGVLESERE